MLTRNLTRRITQALTRKPTEPGNGGAASFDPASLFSSGEQGVWYDPSDFSTMFQDSAGTIPVTAVEQPVGRILDKSGRGNHATQATTANKPILQSIGGKLALVFDGVDDGFSTATFPAGTLTSNMDCFMLVRKDSAANAVYASNGASATYYFAVTASADGSPAHHAAGTPTYLVDGAAVLGTRDALHTALTIGSWHVLEVRNLDLSAWTQFTVGSYAGFMINGGVAEVILAPAQSAEARTQAREYLAAKAGITL